MLSDNECIRNRLLKRYIEKIDKARNLEIALQNSWNEEDYYVAQAENNELESEIRFYVGAHTEAKRSDQKLINDYGTNKFTYIYREKNNHCNLKMWCYGWEISAIIGLNGIVYVRYKDNYKLTRYQILSKNKIFSDLNKPGLQFLLNFVKSYKYRGLKISNILL